MRVLGTAVILAVALARIAAAQQCCADCNGDGEVAINELVTGVVNALNGCNAVPTPTPQTSGCPYLFTADTPSASLCAFVGPINDTGPQITLPADFSVRSGLVVVFLLLDPSADTGVFFGGTVASATTAGIDGWFTQSDASDFMPISGVIDLMNGGSQLRVLPNTPPFQIGGCPFAAFVGSFEGLTGSSAALRPARTGSDLRSALAAFAAARAGRASHALPELQVR